MPVLKGSLSVAAASAAFAGGGMALAPAAGAAGVGAGPQIDTYPVFGRNSGADIIGVRPC
ncbi:hypothetical protein [Streptomyces sp. NPDC007369]|uniref:hypothetical protein n=1 Tax=Streptomyces sp. NPDC007369 TaxID=3154589 RepID=UPI0033C41B1E